MASLSDHLKPQMDALKKIAKDEGITVVEASRRQHRTKLERVSDKSLDQLETMMPDATVGETVKIYDTTRKHLNTIDGLQDTQAATIAVIPGELAARFSLQDEVKTQLAEEQPKIIEGEVAE